MDNRLVLSFMCKNESGVILNMLESVKHVADNIVALDTGSTDDTVNIIKNFCISNKIPFEIYHHVFDNFRNSRNILLERTKEYCNMFYGSMNYNMNNVYWFSVDCDDEMVFNEDFNKNSFESAVYDIKIKTNSIVYRKPTFVRVSDDGKWEGVFHEHYVSYNKYNFSDSVYIQVNQRGDSWSDEYKHLKQALKYELYLIDNKFQNISIRDYFYTGETYLLGGRSDRAMEYFSKVCDLFETNGENNDFISYSYTQRTLYSIGWNDMQSAIDFAMKSYNTNGRVEALYYVVTKLLMDGNMDKAYEYITFMYKEAHGKNPFPYKSSLYVFEDLYKTLIRTMYINICQSMGKIDEINSLNI